MEMYLHFISSISSRVTSAAPLPLVSVRTQIVTYIRESAKVLDTRADDAQISIKNSITNLVSDFKFNWQLNHGCTFKITSRFSFPFSYIYIIPFRYSSPSNNIANTNWIARIVSLHYEYQIYHLSMLTAILMYRFHQNAVVIIHNIMHQFIFIFRSFICATILCQICTIYEIFSIYIDVFLF